MDEVLQKNMNFESSKTISIFVMKYFNNFIELELIFNKLHVFKVYNVVSFDIHICLRNYLHN